MAVETVATEAVHANAFIAAHSVGAGRSVVVTEVGASGALVNIGTAVPPVAAGAPARDRLEPVLATACVAAVSVRAFSMWAVAVVGAQPALVNVSAEETVAAISRPVAGALVHVAVSSHLADEIRAHGIRAAKVCAIGALVDICAILAIANVTGGAFARERARNISAVVHVKTVVRPRRALVNLRA